MSGKGERTAARILDIAEEMFAERGYKETTLRDIAKEVPLQQPSLYNHFPTKEALYQAVLDRAMKPLFERLSEIGASGDWARIDHLPVETSRFLSEHPAIAKLLCRELIATEACQQPKAGWFERVVPAAVQMQKAGGIDTARENMMVMTTMFLLVAAFPVFAPGLAKAGGVDLSTEDLIRIHEVAAEVVTSALRDRRDMDPKVPPL